MLDRVRDRLFIGGAGDAVAVLSGNVPDDSLGEFTHVVSLLESVSISAISYRSIGSLYSKELSRAVVPDGEPRRRALPPGDLLHVVEGVGMDHRRLRRMAVPLRDDIMEDLLDHLDACLDFIDEGRSEGNVLVHCLMGISRSASVVTAYLMRTEKKPLEDSLASLRGCHSATSPNIYFLSQLKMFERMGFKVDITSPIYRQFRLQRIGKFYHLGRVILKSVFEDDPREEETASYTTAYRCNGCKKIVATQNTIVSHVPGQQNFDQPLDALPDQNCPSFFSEPMQWMASSLTACGDEGKLTCSNCVAELGYFSWLGLECSCSAKFKPAFRINKNNVDVSEMTLDDGAGSSEAK